MELEHYIVRKATKDDCGAIHKLIQELADYEKMPDGPKIDAAGALSLKLHQYLCLSNLI